MKRVDALRIIDGSYKQAYRVRYEFSDGRFVTHSEFPTKALQKAEPPLDSLRYAMDLALSFAGKAPEGYRNIKVVYDISGAQVEGTRAYREVGGDA